MIVHSRHMANRRQHTIPKFYLEQFFPGYCYRRGTKSPQYHKRATNVAVQKDYYGGPEDDLNMLDKVNSSIENAAAPVLKRLLYDRTSITRDDWAILSYYFANMSLRTPAFHEGFKRDVQIWTEQLNQMARDMMAAVERAKAEGKDIPEPEGLLHDGSPRFTLDAWNRWAEELETESGRLSMTAAFYGDIKDIAGYIQKMSLFILDAPGGLFFVTTDGPLILLNVSTDSTLGAGWANPDVFVIHPLGLKHFMVMFHAGPATIRGKSLSAEEVHFYNLEIIKHAKMEVYSKYPYDIALDWMHRRGQWAPPIKK